MQRGLFNSTRSLSVPSREGLKCIVLVNDEGEYVHLVSAELWNVVVWIDFAMPINSFRKMSFTLCSHDGIIYHTTITP